MSDDPAREAWAREQWAKLSGDGRYRVRAGSESGHCCFGASVMDTETLDETLGTPTCVCECFDVATSERIAAALNAPLSVEAVCGAAGMGGIYDVFTDAEDALSQMGHYIRELQERAAAKEPARAAGNE